MSNTILFTGVTANYNRQVSNMDYSRLMAYMPKWSAANFVETSNFTKVYSPVGRTLTGMYFNMEDYVANSVIEYLPTECISEVYTAVNHDYETTYNTLAHGTIHRLGEAITSKLSDSPISGIVLGDSFLFNEKYSSVFTKTSFANKLFINSNILYIQVTDSLDVSDYPIRVIISGITEYGVHIDEEIEITGPYTYSTKGAYKMLNRIESDYAIHISNFIDLASTHSYIVSDINKKIFTKSGILFEPIIDYSANKLFINYFNGNSVVDEYIFDTEELDYLFVSASEDVIGFKNGELYCGKLHIPVELQLNANSSYNNNDFIYLNKTSTYIGDEVVVTVNLENIREIFGNEQIQVVVESDGQKTFLNQLVHGTLDDNTWINQSVLNDKILFSIPINNADPVVFKLYVNGFDQYFSAGICVNKIHYKRFIISGITEGVNQLLIRNNKLCIFVQNNNSNCQQFDGLALYKEISFIRDGYTMDDNNIYTQFDFGLT
jgi:hypothetical protein